MNSTLARSARWISQVTFVIWLLCDVPIQTEVNNHELSAKLICEVVNTRAAELVNFRPTPTPDSGVEI